MRLWSAVLWRCKAANSLSGSADVGGTKNKLREIVPQRYTSVMRHLITRMVAIARASATANADIYEWRDANGNWDFTNLLVNVPAAQQPDARVIVTALPASEAAPAAASAPAGSAAH